MLWRRWDRPARQRRRAASPRRRRSAATETAAPSDGLPDGTRPTCPRGPRTAPSTRATRGSAPGPGRWASTRGGWPRSPARQAVPDHLPAGRPQGQGRRRVELARRRPRDPARGVLGDQVDHQHAGRAWRRPTATSTSTTRPALHRGVAGHQVTHGDDPRPPQQRQRPLLGRRQRLRRPAPGRGPHAVRDRPEAAVPARPGLGLQQRRHPDPRPGHLDGDRGAHPRVRRRAAVRPDRHDPHADDDRPCRQHQHVLRHADDLRGPGPLRLPVPAPGPVGRRAGRAAVVGEGGRRPALPAAQRGVRAAVVAQPARSDHRSARHRRARSARAAGRPDDARHAGERLHRPGSRRPDGAGRPAVGDGRGDGSASSRPTRATPTTVRTPPGSSPRRWSSVPGRRSPRPAASR